MPIPRPFRSAMLPVPMTGACSLVGSVDRSFEGENFLFRSRWFLRASSDLTMGVFRVSTMSGGKPRDLDRQAARTAYQQ